VLSGCTSPDIKQEPNANQGQIGPTDAVDRSDSLQDNPSAANPNIESETIFSYINAEGTTLVNRVNPPSGFTRISSTAGDITGFMRDLTLKEDGYKVHLYNGEEKGGPDNQIAVFDFDIGTRDLQQCADSIFRVYAEYYWSLEEYDSIAFHLTNGFLMEYTKWRDGNRLVVDGNNVSWSKTNTYDASYECFRSYLDMVYAYAGTLSLSAECKAIEAQDIRPGDIFLQGGSPGHCVLVIDMAEDENGNQCFLLAQGYMPAQDFHILKNPLDPDDPWYYVSELSYPFETPSYTFHEGSLVRWSGYAQGEDIALSEDDALAAMSTDVIISNEIVATPITTSSQVTILAVGDDLVHTQVVKSGKQADGTYNYDHLFSVLKEDITAADIAVINQETILGGSDFAYSGYPTFNSPTEIGDAIVRAGFDVVLHASNHTMDKGLKGVNNTFAFWKQHPAITVLGINESKEQRAAIPIVEKNGIKIAMLNYTYGLNGNKVPSDMPYLVNLINETKMAEDIEKAKELADFVIVFPHWGTEYVYEATQQQQKLTTFFYEQGVDLVIGAHPHVIEPVEWIETTNNHRMLVYYSLGNYVSYQREAPRMLGGMAKITVTKDAKGTYISDASITPIVTHYEIGPVDYHYGVYKLNDYTKEQSQIHGVVVEETQSLFTLEGTVALAKEVLGSWFE